MNNAVNSDINYKFLNNLDTNTYKYQLNLSN